MILLLGGNGYIGSAFKQALENIEAPFHCPILDALDLVSMVRAIQESSASLVINAAGYVGKPNVDGCEDNKGKTLAGNVLLALNVAQAAYHEGVPWLHVSSGCIYNGPGPYTEEHEPDFSFHHEPCSFYSGSKATAEEGLKKIPGGYICRLRIPFDEFNDPRNYITKLMTYPKILRATNSLSHRGDFARVCLELALKRHTFGIYNITNPGSLSSVEAVELIRDILKPDREFEFWKDDDEFYREAAKTPRSNCVLDVSKLLATGIKLKPVRESFRRALERWKERS